MDTPELDHKTFDLAAALSGRTFPEDTFPVWFDEKSAYELVKANREIDQAVALGDEEAEAKAHRDAQAAKDRLDESKYLFTLRGISSGLKRSLVKIVSDKHNLKPGDQLTDDAYLELRANQIAAYVVEIVSPSGVSFRLTPEEARVLLDEAPDYAIDQVDVSISKLSSGAKAGFELAAMDVDFLSAPSPEVEV